mmetsp:Transcript_14594/g.19203  ORF Transcript_14594/g.19203 Transcript_14594/m.19203 type:complete len:582 (-) Transcript_14594:7-1752(-)
MPPNLFVIMIEFDKHKKKSSKPVIIRNEKINNATGTGGIDLKQTDKENEAHLEEKEIEIKEEEDQITFEYIQDLLRETLNGVKNDGLVLYDPVWTYGAADKAHLTITFPCEVAYTDAVVDRLSRIGIGIKAGALSIIPSVYTKAFAPDTLDEDISSKKAKHSKMLHLLNRDERQRVVEACSKIRVEQVIEQIKDGAVMTFDYVMLVLIAASLAGTGLATDNTVVIVASMLVSPIMGPILAFTFGTTIRNKKLIQIGLRNELVSLLLCVVVGVVIGLIGTGWGVDNCDDTGNEPCWPTYEMSSRGTWDGLLLGVAIAVPSGMGVALSVLGNNTSSLVGVAISASLLPPAVNCGMMIAYAASANAIQIHNSLDEGFAKEKFLMGAASLCLTLVNIACIFFTSIFMFKVKEFAPVKQKSVFWEEDVKRYRQAKLRQKEDVLDIHDEHTEESQDVNKRIEGQEGVEIKQKVLDILKTTNEMGHRQSVTGTLKRKQIQQMVQESMKSIGSNPQNLLSLQERNQERRHEKLTDLFAGLNVDDGYLEGIDELFQEEEESSVGLWKSFASMFNQRSPRSRKSESPPPAT